MNFKLIYDLNNIPSELIMATYNSVSSLLFGYENFDEELPVKHFLEVLDKNADEKIKGKIDRLEARYKQEFRKIMDEYNRNFSNPEYSEKLSSCHDWAGAQFEWLNNQYNSHLNFYKRLQEALPEYLETGMACFKKDEYNSVVVVKGGVIATYTSNKDKQIVFNKIYDKDLHEEKFRGVLARLQNDNKEENEQ